MKSDTTGSQIKIGIIGGNGKMGQYFARFFAAKGHPVVSSDRDTDLSAKHLAKSCDVILLAIPVAAIEPVIHEIRPYLKKSHLLIDIASVKVMPIKVMLKTHAAVIGCHPLFGPSVAMKNQIITIVPARPLKWLPWIIALFESNQAIIKTLTPEKHDDLMAIIQGYRYYHLLLFGLTLVQNTHTSLEALLGLQSPAFRIQMALLARLIDSGSELAAGILFYNPSLRKMLTSRQSNQWATEKHLRKILSSKNTAALNVLFNEIDTYLQPFKEKGIAESHSLISEIYRVTLPPSPPTTPTKNDIAVLGPKHTYTHQSARWRFPDRSVFFCKTITEVFERVASNQLRHGVVPLEDKSQGTVRDTFNELCRANVQITEMVILPITHCLAANPGTTLTDIRFIISKDQAITQCSRYLNQTIPWAEHIHSPSTVEAMDRIIRERRRDAAAIGPHTAAKTLGLHVLETDISNEPNSETKFAVIGTSAPDYISNRPYRTMIAFTCDKDRPGTLVSVLRSFSDHKINLTKIESRPIGNAFDEYLFFLEFDGHTNQPAVQSVLADIHHATRTIHTFGSYETRRADPHPPR